MLDNVREYIDRLHIDGHSLGEDHDDDPVLLDAAGNAVMIQTIKLENEGWERDPAVTEPTER